MTECTCEVGFIISCIRSGSTLLRSILNAHSNIYAPHELHLGFLEIGIASEYTRQSLAIANLSNWDLKAILWKAIYAKLLAASGKSMLIDKSPSNAACWDDINRIWPGAPTIVLYRNPAAIAFSIVRADDGRDLRSAREHILRSMDHMDRVIATSQRFTVVRYEDILARPEQTFDALLGFLGVAFEADILNYGLSGGDTLVYGVGDWGDAIRTGFIQRYQNVAVPDDISVQMADLSARWGY